MTTYRDPFTLEEAMREVRSLRAEIATATKRDVDEKRNHRMLNKREIFQAGRDSYKTPSAPYNTDDEAWDEFIGAKK
jgi:hypothetical protein